MGGRRFFSWPVGWRESILMGLVVGALLIVAQGLGSGWNQLDWCGSAIIVFFVVVGVIALSVRDRRDPSHRGQGK